MEDKEKQDTQTRDILTDNEAKHEPQPATESFSNTTTNNLSFDSFGNAQNSQTPRKEYENIREYAQDLHSWLWQYRMIQAMGSFQSHMVANMNHNARIQQQPASSSTPTNFTHFTNHTPGGLGVGHPVHSHSGGNIY